MPPPKNPCTARHRIICSMVEAKPHRKLATVKPAAEIENNSRVPSARDMKPDSGIAITSAIRYEVCTHDTSLELADSPAWISDSDADTTWMSRIAMNMPKTMIRNAISRRGWIRSDGGAAALRVETVAVVALAMGCSNRVGCGRGFKPAGRDYFGCIICGASRSASLSASLAPSRVSTVV